MATFIMIIASSVCSIVAQSVQSPHSQDYVSNSVGVSNGEVMAARSPALNAHEPSCEELRAMWR